MKRFTSLLLALMICLSLCACGTSNSPSGKYYWESANDTYYEFKDSSNCYLVSSSIGRVTYKYVVNEDSELLENTFVIHISDVSSNSSHKLVFDKNNDTIWDPEFGLFSKK